MAEEDGGIEGRIRQYLADNGGSVADPQGRSLTDQMARALGVDRPQQISVALGEMEDGGVITREMRGLRTYRVALAAIDGHGGSASSPAAPPEASEAPAGAPVAAPVAEPGAAEPEPSEGEAPRG